LLAAAVAAYSLPKTSRKHELVPIAVLVLMYKKLKRLPQQKTLLKLHRFCGSLRAEKASTAEELTLIV